MKTPPPLVLASTSTYRRQLLDRLKIPFECVPPCVDEISRPSEEPLRLVARLALAKARAIAVQQRDAWVIGSDQLAILAEAAGQSVLGKPGTASSCIAQILRCSGKTVLFATAVAVVCEQRGSVHEFLDTTRVRFRSLDPATIERYVEREAPLDCAGGFKSEALGITLCDAIECTDPTALIGLPLIRLSAVLRDVGYELP